MINVRDFIIIILGLSLVSMVYLFSQEEDAVNMIPVQVKDILSKKVSSSEEPPRKSILFYTKIFGKDYGPSEIPDCPVQCIYTHNRTLLKSLGDFDALVFADRLLDVNKLPDPRTRQPGQFYIYMNMESPIHTYTNFSLPQYKFFFNLTATYLQESDIDFSYGKLEPKTLIGAPGNLNASFLEQKDSLISWMVSNCNKKAQRWEYVQELSKYLNITKYGKCFSNDLKREDTNKVVSEHKFYLALENSICNEYITEKFWRALEYGAVPIVFGTGGNHRKHAPRKMYINAEEFDTPKDLAEYILQLDKDDKKYMEYFDWRRIYDVKWLSSVGCEICMKLNDPQLKPKVYENLEFWWRQYQCV